LKRKHLTTMGEPARYAAAAAIASVNDSGLLEEHLRNDRCGLIFGNDSTVGATVESIALVNECGGTHHLGSGYVF
jgi:3-oxoacyl-[acyl-carrier-protein] synthase-1